MYQDFFKSRDILKVGNKQFTFNRLQALEKAGLTTLGKLPFSIRILLEAALRQCNGKEITQEDVQHIASWTPATGSFAFPSLRHVRNGVHCSQRHDHRTQLRPLPHLPQARPALQ